MLPSSWCLADQIYKFRLPTANEPIFGTWTNTDYSGNIADYAQKVVYHTWGFGETFNKVNDTAASGEWTFILVEKWTDDLCNTWYKEFEQSQNGQVYQLVRISKDGSRLELLYNMKAFPQEKELDPKNYDKYRIYYNRS